MKAAESGQVLLLGVEAGQGAVHPVEGGKGTAVDHRPQLGHLHLGRGGLGEDMYVVRPGKLSVGGGGGVGVVVAGGEKDLCLQLLQDLIEGLDRFRPGPLAVKEVPRQKDQVNLCLAGGVRQAG